MKTDPDLCARNRHSSGSSMRVVPGIVRFFYKARAPSLRRVDT